MTVFKINIDGDAGSMVGIGNDITAVAEITDSCIDTLIAAILREIHFQGIAASDIATLWFFLKNAALYDAVVGNGRSKRAIFNLAIEFIGNGIKKSAAGNCTMIYNVHVVNATRYSAMIGNTGIRILNVPKITIFNRCVFPYDGRT